MSTMRNTIEEDCMALMERLVNATKMARDGNDERRWRAMLAATDACYNCLHKALSHWPHKRPDDK